MSTKMKKIFLMIIASGLSFGQLYAQNPNFRFATTTTTNQVIDSLITIGSSGHISVPVAKTINTVDNGNITVETNYYINASMALAPTTKKTNTYDGNNMLSGSITAKWNSSLSQFVDSLQYDYNYPVNDVCIETIFKISGGLWVLSDSVKTVTTYNSNQDPTLKITYASIGGLWVDSLKEATVYDLSNRFTEKEIAVWNGSTWVNFKKTEVTYNPDNKTANGTFYDWDGSTWIASTYSFQLIPVTINATMTYSMVNKTALPVIENAIENVKTYPNPTVDGFYVNAGNDNVKVEIISVNGDLLLTKEVSGTEYIRVNTIGKGTFLVRLSTNGKSVTKKLFVK